MTARVHKKIGVLLVLAWLLTAGVALLLPAWSQTTTYTLELTPIADSMVLNGYPSNNYGDDSELQLGAGDGDRLFFKFNLSQLQNVKSIVSMKLKLYVTTIIKDTGGSYVDVRYCEDNWEESTITWSNQPSCTDIITYEPDLDDPVADSWIEINIYTGAEASYITDNYILSIRLDTGSATAVQYKVASKEYPEADKWPQLIIEYEPYTETTTQTVTETITITENVTETITETQTTTTTLTDYVTETQTTTITQTDTIYTTETAYTTETSTVTQTITDVITETATTTITQIETAWANQTVTITTTMTPTTTVTVYGNETVTMTEYGNSTAPEINYQALTDALMPIVLIVGVLGTLLGLLLQSTSFRRGD